jgi:hypothetical protein
MVIESPTSVVVQMMDGSLVRGSAIRDDESHRIQINLDNSVPTNFDYLLSNHSALSLQSNAGHRLRIRMHPLDGSFLLSTERVRWVHPFPPVKK